MSESFFDRLPTATTAECRRCLDAFVETTDFVYLVTQAVTQQDRARRVAAEALIGLTEAEQAAKCQRQLDEGDTYTDRLRGFSQLVFQMLITRGVDNYLTYISDLLATLFRRRPETLTEPATEPELWIGQVLRGLTPTPRFVPQVWQLDDDRTAGVVWVDPVDEPPCITAQGQVYERVSAATIPVTDPARLDALYRGGQHARGRAERFANRAAKRALEERRWFGYRSVGVAVALAAVGRKTDDIASRLFVPSFRDAMAESLRQFFRTADPMRGRDTPEGGAPCRSRTR